MPNPNPNPGLDKSSAAYHKRREQVRRAQRYVLLLFGCCVVLAVRLFYSLAGGTGIALHISPYPPIQHISLVSSCRFIS